MRRGNWFRGENSGWLWKLLAAFLKKNPWTKIPHLFCREDAAPWAHFLPTVAISTLNTVHSYCAASVQPQPPVVVLLLQKSQEKLPSISKCGFSVLQNLEISRTTLIFAHKHTLPQPHLFCWHWCAELLFQHLYYRWGIFQTLLRKQGWMVSTPKLKMGGRIPEEVEEGRLGGSCHLLQVTVTLPPAPWWLLPWVCTVWTWIQLIVN